MNILIVDDEELIRNVVKEYLEANNYNVMEAVDGKDAINKIKFNDYDLIILDIMMPNLDGVSVLKEIRETKDVPVIMLSARNQEYDKLEGFEYGADDYITKPFSPKELVARVKSILKRTNKIHDTFTYKGLVIDYEGHTVSIDGKEVKYTPKEYEILCYLVENKNIAVSRETILEKLWGYSFFGDDRTIDTHIKKIRNGLGKYRDLITTVRGMGYKFEIKEK